MTALHSLAERLKQQGRERAAGEPLRHWAPHPFLPLCGSTGRAAAGAGKPVTCPACVDLVLTFGPGLDGEAVLLGVTR